MRLTYLLTLLNAGSLIAGCSPSAGFDSPEEACMAEQAALRNGEYGKVYDGLTPESQKFGIGGILTSITLRINRKVWPDEYDPRGIKAYQAYLDKLVDLALRHGVDAWALPDDASTLDVEAYLALADRFPVDNPREFYAEYWQLQEDARNSPWEDAQRTSIFTIDDLEHEGDYAYAVKRRAGDETRFPIAFQRIQGRWFVDDVANFKRR
jgi:hypothetical protein